ncbi:creatininase [Roseovarius spongiae]|uniref:Creatininase n=1 Tax=Roseovarius spongiae TaxID=2320272 RepID=A0A3A8BBF2_9RHOB|nr:creatininase [Roseovarius spongiae]RKF16744.1 creatininase [Roseovarius spongiae]
MSELAWDEYQRRLREEDAIVFVPVGAVEQHGYHLPLGTDWMMARYMARRVAAKVGGVVAEPIAYGATSQIRTGGGPHRCGTTSLNAETLIALLHDVLVGIGRHGARKIAVIDSHFENRFFLDEACHRAQDTLALRGHEARILKMLYAERINPETMAAVYRGMGDPPGLDLEHGGVLETAMMLYCHPELVDMSRMVDEARPDFPPYDVYPVNPDWVPASGCLSSGRTATREIGELLVEEFVGHVTDAVRSEFR